MTGPKRTPTQREDDLEKAARLDRRGFTQAQIAEQLGVSRQQITYDLKILRRRYAATQIGELAAAQAEKLEQLREVRVEAWEAWERSKKDRERETTEARSHGEKGDDGKPKPPSTKATKLKEGRLPGHQYLRIIKDCLKEEAQILLAAHQAMAAQSLADAIQAELQARIDAQGQPPRIIPPEAITTTTTATSVPDAAATSATPVDP